MYFIAPTSSLSPARHGLLVVLLLTTHRSGADRSRFVDKAIATNRAIGRNERDSPGIATNGTRTLLGAKGITISTILTTRNKKLLGGGHH